MIMIQLNPQWPCNTPHGSGWAIALIDYGQDHDTLYKVQITDGPHAGELWDFRQSEVRAVENITYGRNGVDPGVWKATPKAQRRAKNRPRTAKGRSAHTTPPKTKGRR